MASTLYSLSAGGARIAFTEEGSGDLGFALVHAWACDRSTMSGLAGHLATRGRVVTLELRGHGQSDQPPGPYRADDFYADVSAVPRAAGMPRVVIVGHSLGGRVALGLAAKDPDLVAGVVVLDSTVIKPAEYARPDRKREDELDWASSLETRISRMFIPTDHSRPLVAEVMRRTRQAAAMASLEASAEIDTVRALAAYQGPVLYIGASTPREERLELQALKPDLQYGQVVQSGHFVQLDARAQVEAMIDRFCDTSLLATSIGQ